MAEKIVVHGTSYEDVVAKARELIKMIDEYKSPMLEGTFQKDENDWVAYVKYWGLD